MNTFPTDVPETANNTALAKALADPWVRLAPQAWLKGAGLACNSFGRIEGNQCVIQPGYVDENGAARDMLEGEALMQLQSPPFDDGNIYKQQAREAVHEGVILDGGGRAWKGTLWKSTTTPKNAGIARLIRRGCGYRGAHIGMDCLIEQYVLRERETVFGNHIGELLRNHWQWGGATDVIRRAMIYDQNQIGTWICHEATVDNRPMNDIVYEDCHWHEHPICNMAICGVNPNWIPVSVRIVGGGSEYATKNQTDDASMSRTPTDNFDPAKQPVAMTAKRAGFYLQGGELTFENFTFNDANAYKIIRLDGPASVNLVNSGGGGTQSVKLVSREHRQAQCMIFGRFTCVGGVEGVQRWPDWWARRTYDGMYDPMNYSYLIGAPMFMALVNSFNLAHRTLRGPAPLLFGENGATVVPGGYNDMPAGSHLRTPWLEGGAKEARWSGSGNFPIYHGFVIQSPVDCVAEVRLGNDAWPVIPIPLYAGEKQQFVYTHGGTNYDNFLRISVENGGKLRLSDFQSWHGRAVDYNRAVTALMNGDR